MNLEQLQSFVEVQALGHFTKAAEKLHLAQPSLSRQIATLEAELGVALLNRTRGNVSLTAAGDRLLPIARRMLADAETARTEMAELAGLKRGRVRLGATPTLCTSIVADVLGLYHARYPGIDIEIIERGSLELTAALLDGSLDLALVVSSHSMDRHPVLEREPILSEQLVVVSAAEQPDPFNGAKSVSLAELAKVPQLMFPGSYDLRATVDEAFQAKGITPLVAVAGAEMDAALSFTKHGIGVTVVPAMVAGARSRLRARPVDGLTRTVSIARRTDMAPTHASAGLHSAIIEIADRLTAPGADLAQLVTRVN